MRELKFRAWDVANKKMFPVSDVSFGDDGSARTIVFQTSPKGKYYRGLVHGENGHLMQYTGLQDRHGKDIYEGDILQNREIDVCGAVTWVNNGPGFVIIDPNETGAFVIHEQWEIIGNIYETPELLKVEVEA